MPVRFGRGRAGPTAGGVHVAQQAAVEWSITAQGRAPFDAAHVVQRSGLCGDGVVESMLAEGLDRPLVQVVRLGQDRGRGVFFKQDVVDFVIRQEARQAQADAATTYDHHRDINDRGRLHCFDLTRHNYGVTRWYCWECWECWD